MEDRRSRIGRERHSFSIFDPRFSILDLRLIQVSLRVPVQIAELVRQSPAIVGLGGKNRQRQMERARQNEIGGWLDVIKSADNLVGQLVVFSSTNPVNEQITQEQTSEQRGHQGSASNFDALDFQP